MTSNGKRKRVLVLIKGLGLGGAETLLVNALPYWDRERFAYQVAYFLPWKDALVPRFEAAGVPVTCLNSRSVLDVGVVHRVAKMLQGDRIDVLHAHLPWASIVGRRAAGRADTKAVVYTEHGCWERLNPVTRYLNRSTLKSNDVVIAVSEEVRKSMRGATHPHIVTIPNGIDCRTLAAVRDERPDVCAELGIRPHDFLVVKVANLSPVKNHELLINAFAGLLRKRPDASLLLVGQLRERDGVLRELAGRLGISDRLHIVGPRTDVPRLVKACDVFAMSSRSEGLPVSLLEAMALGKPVVCTAVGGIPGVVRDGVQGLLVESGDAEKMTEALIRLRDDEALRERMGREGRELVSQNYDVAMMVRKVEAIYEEVLGRAKRVR